MLRQLDVRLVNKCMSTHLNANTNVSLDSNANAYVIFQERIQMQMQLFGVALKCKCKYFGYTFANVFELILNVLALYERFVLFGETKQRNVYKHIINLFNKYSSALL